MQPFFAVLAVYLYLLSRAEEGEESVVAWHEKEKKNKMEEKVHCLLFFSFIFFVITRTSGVNFAVAAAAAASN